MSVSEYTKQFTYSRLLGFIAVVTLNPIKTRLGGGGVMLVLTDRTAQ